MATAVGGRRLGGAAQRRRQGEGEEAGERRRADDPEVGRAPLSPVDPALPVHAGRLAPVREPVARRGKKSSSGFKAYRSRFP